MPLSFLTCWSNLSGNCGNWVKLCGNEHQEKVKHNKRTTLHNKAGQHSPLNIRFQKGGCAYSSQQAMRTIRPSLYVVKQTESVQKWVGGKSRGNSVEQNVLTAYNSQWAIRMISPLKYVIKQTVLVQKGVAGGWEKNKTKTSNNVEQNV